MTRAESPILGPVAEQVRELERERDELLVALWDLRYAAPGSAPHTTALHRVAGLNYESVMAAAARLAHGEG
jgi:hypothetical protein